MPAVFYTEPLGLLRLAELWVQNVLLIMRYSPDQRAVLANDRSYIFVTRCVGAIAVAAAVAAASWVLGVMAHLATSCSCLHRPCSRCPRPVASRSNTNSALSPALDKMTQGAAGSAQSNMRMLQTDALVIAIL